MVESKDEQIDPVPALTPAQLAANEAFQAAMAERFQLRQSPADLFAARVIEDHLEMIAHLKTLRRKLGTASPRHPELTARIATLQADAAEHYILLGQFDRAMAIAPKRAKLRFRSYIRALSAPDDDWCSHRKWKRVDTNDGPQLIPNYYREFDFYDVKRGRELSMLHCAETGCRYRNARELPTELANLSANRAKLRAVMAENNLNTVESVKTAGIFATVADLATKAP